MEADNRSANEVMNGLYDGEVQTAEQFYIFPGPTINHEGKGSTLPSLDGESIVFERISRETLGEVIGTLML